MDSEAADFIDAVVNDAQQPVVLFALEWCEFCWSARNLFKKLNISYRSVDLDSVEFQAEERGQKIRAELKDRTGFTTIPQIFIGGQFVGGCTDLFDAWNEGSIQKLLTENGVSYVADDALDPYSFLPEWLHPR